MISTNFFIESIFCTQKQNLLTVPRDSHAPPRPRWCLFAFLCTYLIGYLEWYLTWLSQPQGPILHSSGSSGVSSGVQAHSVMNFPGQIKGLVFSFVLWHSQPPPLWGSTTRISSSAHSISHPRAPLGSGFPFASVITSSSAPRQKNPEWHWWAIQSWPLHLHWPRLLFA